MTPTELKAWILGFEQGRDGGAPDLEDWATIRQHIAEMDLEPSRQPGFFPVPAFRLSETQVPLKPSPPAFGATAALMQTLRQRASTATDARSATVTSLKPRGLHE